jgi:hypothetical protein
LQEIEVYRWLSLILSRKPRFPSAPSLVDSFKNNVCIEELLSLDLTKKKKTQWCI